MNTNRFFRLSNLTLARLQEIDSNRSRVITAALQAVYDDPQIIMRELQERMAGKALPAEGEQSRATAYLPGYIAGGLDDLVNKLRLPTEEVVRLAIDAHIRKVATPKKASHEPSRPLQPSPEG